jgi:hypothetical protein
MARALVAMTCLLGLTGCAGWLPSMDLRGAGGLSTAELRLDSEPSGAEARVANGPACRTPCALAVTTAGDVSVTFTLDGFHPQTVPVRFRPAGDSRLDPSASETPRFDPNPVVAELQPVPPPRRRARPAPRRNPPPAGQPPRRAPQR